MPVFYLKIKFPRAPCCTEKWYPVLIQTHRTLQNQIPYSFLPCTLHCSCPGCYSFPPSVCSLFSEYILETLPECSSPNFHNFFLSSVLITSLKKSYVHMFIQFWQYPKRCYYCPHFINEKTKAQTHWLSNQGYPSFETAMQGFSSGCLCAESSY